MKHITEFFGTGFLHLAAGSLIVTIFAAFLREGGTISDLVLLYFQMVCGG